MVVWFLSGNFIDDSHAAQPDTLGNSVAVVAIVAFTDLVVVVGVTQEEVRSQGHQ